MSDREYGFSLLVEYPGDPGELADRLFDAGCDDSSLSVVDGALILRFDRSASGFREALFSALEDLRRASGDLTVVALDEPADLVTASDIADFYDRSRASIQQLASGTRGGAREAFPFPAARAGTRHRLWRLAEVAEWFSREADHEYQQEQADLTELFNSCVRLQSNRLFGSAEHDWCTAFLEDRAASHLFGGYLQLCESTDLLGPSNCDEPGDPVSVPEGFLAA